MRGDCATRWGFLAALLLASAGPGGPALAQRPDEADQRAFYQRRVQIPPHEAPPAVVMAEFFTHGELDEKAEALAVYDARHQPMSWRILQAGPGDYCRIAFQTAPRQSLYKIYYGLKAPRIKPLAWTSTAGLLLETRRWSSCDLNSLDSVRSAFQASSPYGSAFVPSVFHRCNPFHPAPEPFLSDYRGTLHITAPGRYRFFTSSQDASFLLIDEKPVVAAPGGHGSVGDARIKGEVDLAAGPHTFEYLHAAAGPEACMVAAWQPPGASKPEMIPPRAFEAESIARLSAPSVKHPREFSMETLGEVPLAEGEHALVRVQFRLVAPAMTLARRKLHWDFGDGQISTQPDPVHVYLHPGIYNVTMRVPGEAEASAVVNRVPVHRALDPGRRARSGRHPGRVPGHRRQVRPGKAGPGGAVATRPRLRSGGGPGSGRQGGPGGAAWAP